MCSTSLVYDFGPILSFVNNQLSILFHATDAVTGKLYPLTPQILPKYIFINKNKF